MSNGVDDGVELGHPNGGRLSVDAGMCDVRVGQIREVESYMGRGKEGRYE